MHHSNKSPRVHWRIFVKTFSLQKNFVATTSRTNSDWFDFLRLVVATKFCGTDKDFHKKFSSTHKMICCCDRRNVMLQAVTWPVHTQSDLSPDVLQQLVSFGVFQPLTALSIHNINELTDKLTSLERTFVWFLRWSMEELKWEFKKNQAGLSFF